MATRSALLLVNKPSGITSFASLYPVKRHIDRKVGHAGTLDKFAQGLMIVLTGSFTRLNPLFSSMDKSYIATICFGTETSTLDPEGDIINTLPIPDLPLIEQMLKQHFSGEIMQAPPQYSAIHIAGVRAYKLARGGTTIEMPQRPITIKETEIIDWQPPFLTIRIDCSKGTYIRSFARDLGVATGSCAYLTHLERISIGPYKLEDAVDPTNTDLLLHMVDMCHELLHLLPGFCEISVAENALKGLTHGNMPKDASLIATTAKPGDRYASLLSEEGTLLAVVSLTETLKPLRIISLVCTEEVLHDSP
jgi:tRNA pseudouridine55 synthase